MSLVMSNHRGGRRPRRHERCPSSEEQGLPGITGDGVGGDDRAPRSEESPVSLAMTKHRGVPGIASDDRAPRSEEQGVLDVGGDDQAPRSEESPASLAMTEQ